ncbi:hypothetical protein [Nakamurella endophytica]|uniref:hypothetical protein n=1 Tax=Nakamurella endophytica TaxID=1748367 RepID=UPI001E639E34|nr:hypothetical protein [Nakamurella endophytica]
MTSKRNSDVLRTATVRTDADLCVDAPVGLFLEPVPKLALSAERGLLALSAERGLLALSAERGLLALSAERGLLALSAERGLLALSADRGPAQKW